MASVKQQATKKPESPVPALVDYKFGPPKRRGGRRGRSSLKKFPGRASSRHGRNGGKIPRGREHGHW
jgi:hypothetical protein